MTDACYYFKRKLTWFSELSNTSKDNAIDMCNETFSKDPDNDMQVFNENSLNVSPCAAGKYLLLK